MLLNLFFLLFATGCVYGLMKDFGAYSFIVLIGFLQDPARKLMAGEPIYMTVAVGVVVACIALRQMFSTQNSFTDPFARWSGNIPAPLVVYLLLILIQGVHSLVRYGSPFVTTLGAIFYVAPLLAIIIGYSQFYRFEIVRGFMVIFSVLALVAAVSVLLAFSGFQSPLLNEVGGGLIIYDQGTILKAHSGVMRSSEIAGWHMGACVCFLIILTADKASLASILLASVLIVLLISSIILTGRRKMILQIVVFSTIYIPLLRFYQGALSMRFMLVVMTAIGILSMFIYTFVPSLAGGDYELYLARGTSVFGDAGERFSTLGIGSIAWAYNLHGFLGGGLGVATQGSQHFIEGFVGGAGEGGLGKLVSELGIIALLIVPWLAYAFAVHLHRCLQLVSTTMPGKLGFSVGVLAFLVANIPTFIVASQVYGDVFVLLILGLLAGALFALPKQVIAKLDVAR